MNDEDRLTVVNVVASTRVAEELDLPDIAIQLNCEYEPEQFPGVVYRVSDPKLAILMFRSGRAVCTGGKDEDNIHTGIERMISDLREAGITTWDLKDVEIEVQNMVATYALHYPEDFDGHTVLCMACVVRVCSVRHVLNALRCPAMAKAVTARRIACCVR